MRSGEQNVLWSSKIKWFAKSSGTTNSKSKFIPVSNDAIEYCHYKGGKDLLSIYCNNYPETNIFKGKSLLSLSQRQRNNLIQYVFQDPTNSLNPRKTMLQSLLVPTTYLLGLKKDKAYNRIKNILK